MTEQKNETPKRKRRTETEIEAARAAGETPVERTNKKVEEATKNEEQASKEDAQSEEARMNKLRRVKLLNEE